MPDKANIFKIFCDHVKRAECFLNKNLLLFPQIMGLSLITKTLIRTVERMVLTVLVESELDNIFGQIPPYILPILGIAFVIQNRKVRPLKSILEINHQLDI